MKTDPGKPIQELADTLEKRRKAPDVDFAEKENTLVLVVDDHPANRNVIVRQLNMALPELPWFVQLLGQGLMALS